MELPELPEPEVVGCYFEEGFQPHLPAMCLDWKGNAAALSSRPWLLPNGSSLTGPAPVRFGIEIHRRSWDGYAVRLVWNETCFEWSNLMRKQLLNCCFGAILAAMGTDLLYLLDQPVQHEATASLKAG
jgi:hypothetical protein